MTDQQPKVIVCRTPQFPGRRILNCPNCKQRRRFAVLDRAWYGPIITCCHCGDSYGEDGRYPRPARRGWRAEEAAKAKRIWDEAGRYTKADHRAWLHQQLAA